MIKIKAAEITAPRQITLVEDEIAAPGPREIGVRSLYSGISHGTEMNVYRGSAPMWQRKRDPRTRLFVQAEQPDWQYPLRYGYACVGVVTDVGRDVAAIAEGDLVYCAAPHQSAHVLPANSVVKLPQGIEPKVGVLMANLNTTFNGVLDADLHLGECVVVFGQGVLGQLTVQWAKLSGASPVIAVDPIAKRLQIASNAGGADLVFDPTQVEDIANSVVKLPQGIEPKVGVLMANLNTTFNGVLDADLHLGECVVVFGQGVLGQLTVQWAKLSGASPVIAVDPIAKRLQIASNAGGADLVFDPTQVEDIAMAVRELTGDRGADVVFEFSGNDRALNEAIRTACYNGKVIVMSWYPGALANVYPGAEFHHNRIQLISSQAGGIRPELSHRWTPARRMDAVLSLMPKLRLEELITDVIDHDDAAAAYELIDKRPQEILQVVLAYRNG
jgi:threonine dehydrogenase-like Zn-dependent dehydrogenase